MASLGHKDGSGTGDINGVRGGWWAWVTQQGRRPRGVRCWSWGHTSTLAPATPAREGL